MKNEKKKNSEHATNFSPENIANDAKKRFQRFWTWDSKNGAKVTLGTTLDDLYKEDSSILALFLRYWQIHDTVHSILCKYQDINSTDLFVKYIFGFLDTLGTLGGIQQSHGLNQPRNSQCDFYQ